MRRGRAGGGLEPLGPAHWPELYRLMVARRFPGVPESFREAKPFFAGATLYGLMDGSALRAGFVFGPPEDGIAFFDVVCAAEMQGKWATPRVLKALARLAFVTLGLRALWVQVAHRKALRAGLQAGFVPATALDVRYPVLMMTPFNARKFLMKGTKGRKKDG